MDSKKTLFETSDQEDSIDETTESDSHYTEQISATSLILTGGTINEEILEEHSISQTKFEEPSDSHSVEEEDELLIPLNFFLHSATDEVKTTTKSEKKKSEKQERRQREKKKKRKLVHSCSELEDENETTILEDSAVIKKDKSKKGKERKKIKKQREENESKDESDHELIPKKTRPNYFVAVRVSNPTIHSSVKVIQDSMVNFDKLLQPALIPISTLHITLMVMHLQTEEVEKAVEVLKSCERDFKDLFDESLSMTFEELAHFRNEVVFGKMNNEEEVEKLKLLATVVRNNYEKNGILSTDDRPFTPHLTITKLSRMQKKRKRKLKKIPPESYTSWLDCELGKETVSEVLLCSMNHEKDEEGFYHCAGSVCISDGIETIHETTEPSQD
ncbi:uncharacterized protein LOC116295700 [Actinia tenebrosa]|uniref:Uncharacterized protein LOC116295700 n=1 Tax=Actinia tenebrosa TaxID=6105 RepID=A0A6P8I3I6_ACTTE|nr:uncharacterized protein LOC116295700 [Actinia tenebrosa]